MFKIFSSLIFLCGLMLLSQPAVAATYYVATTGNDISNSCTQAQSISTPKQTIAAGIGCLSDNSGDTLIVRDGTYNEEVRAANLRWPHGNSPANAITIKAENIHGATVYDIVVEPNNDGSVPAYLIIDGFTVRPCNGCNTGARIAGTKPSTIVRFVTFQNMDIGNPNHYTANTLAHIITIDYFTDNTSLLNSIVHDAWQDHGFDPITTGGYGCYCNGDHMLFEGNTFHDNTGYALHLYNSGTGVNNAIVRNNTFYNNGFNDWVRNISPSQVILYGGNCQIYNNVFYATTNPSLVEALAITYNGNNLVYNNTFYNNTNAAPISLGSSSFSNIVRNNLFVGNGGGNVVNDASSGSTLDHNLSTASPAFVNAGAGDFHLTGSSPAVDAGATLTLFTRDIDGTLRGNTGAGTGTLWDIGAYEFSGTAPPPVQTSLVFSIQPASSTPGTTLPAFAVTILDQYGAPMTSATDNVTIVIATNPGGATLAGTTVRSAASGVATFTNIALNNVGTGYTLKATASFFLGGVVSLPFDITSATGDITTGLIGCWDFEEGIGTTVSGCPGSASQGGSLVNSPLWVNGLSGQSALLFNGLTTYVNIPTWSAINNLAQKTVAAKVKLMGYGQLSKGRIVDKRSSGTGWVLFVDNSAVPQALAFNQDFSGGGASWYIPNVLTTGVTYCVMVTYDRTSTSNVPTFYIDKVGYAGTLSDSAPSGSASSDAANDVRIGDTGSNNRVFDGVIDKVRVWNRLLTTADRLLYCDEVMAPRLMRTGRLIR